uniref:Uncharacterized protein n=1 Tax=Anguilla anguilla TaxID=7936 RepID=A0A0E9TTN4_ANGAN
MLMYRGQSCRLEAIKIFTVLLRGRRRGEKKKGCRGNRNCLYSKHWM